MTIMESSAAKLKGIPLVLSSLKFNRTEGLAFGSGGDLIIIGFYPLLFREHYQKNDLKVFLWFSITYFPPLITLCLEC